MFNKSAAVLFLYSNVVGLAQAGKLLKKRIQHTKTLDQTITKNIYKQVHLNTDKHILRRTTRHHQLAYAFLRGRKYRTVENSCAGDNQPSSSLITEILKNLLYKYDFEKLVVSEEHIKKWLAGEV